MINCLAIVGCGTVGSSLAIRLSQQKLISELSIYDFDNVSIETTKSCYPFLVNESGLPKILITKFICQKLNPNLTVSTYSEKITKPIPSLHVIDCRDCKDPDISAIIRVSLDGELLYIDSRSSKYRSLNYHQYITIRNENYIQKAIDIIIDYLKKDNYIFRDFRLYNLENSSEYILKREDDNDCTKRDT